MQFHSFIKFDSSLFILVILSRKVWFSPRTMDLLHRHHHWQSSFPLSFLVSSFRTSVTTCSDCWLHQHFFHEPLYFHHISSGVPSVPHHFQFGGGQFWADSQDALMSLPHGWDILVTNEKGMADAEETTGRGRGWQRTTRRPPQTRVSALTPEPLHKRPLEEETSRTRMV